ncbi:hypothetical protein [Streptomyces sp. CC224B]|uniref:hypothetical protein n=1 Tax=Streptomyces sp. CC224B TaxID=3044571 RepID=UPI0024A9CE22|nr:hypothetical protein [Streptomyces sp. CC224B]
MGAVALAVLAALLVVGDTPQPGTSAGLVCAEGLRGTGDDRTRGCVGLLADGSPSPRNLGSSSTLAPVLTRIIAENHRVVDASAASGGRPFVSVVYMAPITAEHDGTGLMESVRHDLEGAYLAQRQANASPRGAGLRLLFAQTGGTTEQREYTVGHVLGRRRADRIVAVVGLGGSTASSQDMVGKLTAGVLPAFGSVLTADSWSGTPALVRVAPVNADQPAAAVRFLSVGERADDKFLFVQDVDTGDQCTSTPVTQFRARIPAGRLVGEEPLLFDSPQPSLTEHFRVRLAGLCTSRPDVVYFAAAAPPWPPSSPRSPTGRAGIAL